MLFVNGHRCCIHSDIPYEEQRKAFEPALNGKIKLIIANNSAVSSVTFPDVDTVIDLGASPFFSVLLHGCDYFTLFSLPCPYFIFSILSRRLFLDFSLGTHKCIQYSNMSHRSTLRDLWISKATATQRAGRTGRVRDGTVYRLYSSKASKGFDDFDEPEIAR